MKTILNRKGIDAGFVVIFAVAVLATLPLIYISMDVAAEGSGTVKILDNQVSANLLMDALVNSPTCLLYIQEETVSGNIEVISTRGVIDWGRTKYLSDNENDDCVTKGPYFWHSYVEDLDENEEFDFGSVCEVDVRVEKKSCTHKEEDGEQVEDKCTYVQKYKGKVVATYKDIKPSEKNKKVPNIYNILQKNSILANDRWSLVLIKEKEEYRKGNVSVFVASKDVNIDLEKTESNKYRIWVTNIGNCKAKYLYSISIINSTTDGLADQAEIPGVKIKKGSDEGIEVSGGPFELKEGSSAKIDFEILNHEGIPYGHNLKIDFWLDDRTDYVKTLRRQI